jgi:hypothetical protein
MSDCSTLRGNPSIRKPAASGFASGVGRRRQAWASESVRRAPAPMALRSSSTVISLGTSLPSRCSSAICTPERRQRPRVVTAEHCDHTHLAQNRCSPRRAADRPRCSAGSCALWPAAHTEYPEARAVSLRAIQPLSGAPCLRRGLRSRRSRCGSTEQHSLHRATRVSRSAQPKTKRTHATHSSGFTIACETASFAGSCTRAPRAAS